MIRCVAFDFARKHEHAIESAGVTGAIASGLFVWIDVRAESADPEGVRTLIDRELVPVLGLDDATRDRLSRAHPDTSYEHLPDALHLVLAACDYRAAAEGPARVGVRASRVDVLMTKHYLLTLGRGPVEFLDRVRRDYAEDFRRFAHSPGFLLYEVWDHLTRSYESVEQELETEVERIQTHLAEQPDEQVFPRAARVAADLVRLRRHVAPARAVVHEIGTRRFEQVPETTQPYLQSTASELDRVLTDLTTSREILNDAVNLAMSFVNFRTNRIINRLSTVSFIFLPLTFLVGVYGMNFDHQPEYRWTWGYAYFWGLAVAVAVGCMITLRVLWQRERWRGVREGGGGGGGGKRPKNED